MFTMQVLEGKDQFNLRCETASLSRPSCLIRERSSKNAESVCWEIFLVIRKCECWSSTEKLHNYKLCLYYVQFPMSHLCACFWAKHLYTEKIPECGGSVRRPRKLEPCSACPSRAHAVCPLTVCFTQGVMCSETRTALWRVLLSPCTVSQTRPMTGVTKDLCNNVGSRPNL